MKPRRISLLEYTASLPPSTYPSLDGDVLCLFAQLANKIPELINCLPMYYVFDDGVVLQKIPNIPEYTFSYALPFDIIACNMILQQKSLPLFENPIEYLSFRPNMRLTTDTLEFVPEHLKSKGFWLSSPWTKCHPNIESFMDGLDRKKRWTLKKEMQSYNTENISPLTNLVDKFDQLIDWTRKNRNRDRFALLRAAWSIAISTHINSHVVGNEDLYAVYEERWMPNQEKIWIFQDIFRKPGLKDYARQQIMRSSVLAESKGVNYLDTTVVTQIFDMVSEYGVYKKLAATVPNSRPIFLMGKNLEGEFSPPYWKNEWVFT